MKLRTSNKISTELSPIQIRLSTIPKANIMMQSLNQWPKRRKMNVLIACFPRKDKVFCHNMKPNQNPVLKKLLHLMSKVKKMKAMKMDIEAPKIHKITFD